MTVSQLIERLRLLSGKDGMSLDSEVLIQDWTTREFFLNYQKIGQVDIQRHHEKPQDLAVVIWVPED